MWNTRQRPPEATKADVPDAVSVYDAAGMRVAERVNDVWRFSIYDIGGKIVAEYGGVGATDEGGVKYLLSDWQGSTRAMMSNGGVVKARMDYTAYGEEIQAGVGLRTATQGFDNSTALRQRYGLTERDSATGLDHTWFRKNENRGGRWTSPDPYLGSMLLGDPQTFNRYSYVQGQPTNFIDPSGLAIAMEVFSCVKITTVSYNEHGEITGVNVTWDCGYAFSTLVGGGSSRTNILDEVGTSGGGGLPKPPPPKPRKCKPEKGGTIDYNFSFGYIIGLQFGAQFNNSHVSLYAGPQVSFPPGAAVVVTGNKGTTMEGGNYTANVADIGAISTSAPVSTPRSQLLSQFWKNGAFGAGMPTIGVGTVYALKFQHSC